MFHPAFANCRGWAMRNSSVEPNIPPLVELAYTFDRMSNILSRTDDRTGSVRKRDRTAGSSSSRSGRSPPSRNTP
jgi:hypothetical protein